MTDRKLIVLVVLFAILASLPLSCLADCNWATDIVKIDENHYSYSRDCHLATGKLVKQAPLKDQQIAELEKTIELKDLALTESNKRTELWMSTSIQLTDTLNKYESIRANSGWLHFGLGVASVVVSAYVLGQIRGH